nr:hypothetical protein [uncultured Methanoregula sp.]
MKTCLPLSLLGILFIALLVCGCASPFPGGDSSVQPGSTGTAGIPVGSGQYVFSDMLGNADQPITVSTYRPAAWNTSGPILIVMHGAGRGGAPTRDVWIPYSEQYSALIVAPEFSAQYYPGDFNYNGGNMFSGENQTPRNKANWTFTAIEHVFDDVRSRSGAKQETYLLFGHSAGGQFVHRLATFLPEARFSRAIAANAGLYAMPAYTVRFPYGLYGSPLTQDELKRVFSRKLIIMSGDRDINPNDGGLANFPEAEAQGSTRFARAKNYFETAKQESARLTVPLDWEYHIVPGIGHDEAGMARASAPVLFNGT